MWLRKPALYRLAAAIPCLLAWGGLRAELIKISPFLPPQSAAAAPTANAPLEYRGIMEMANVEQHRIVDPARKVGSWLKVGERDANLDVLVKQHDADRESITVEHGGQTITLSLKVPKVVSSGAAPQIVAPPPVASVPVQNVSPAVLSTVVANPTPADEQRRLEAIAAEVARRRALREQAAQQAQQGQQGAQNATRQDLQQQMQRPQPVAR